jgi:hypothetical protein
MADRFHCWVRKKTAKSQSDRSFAKKNKEEFLPHGSVQDTGVYMGKRAQKK